jgi:CRP-like cAMP-binding protein
MSRDDRIAELARVPIFAGLDRKELRSIEKVLHERTFEPGWTIAEEGKEGVGFFVIETGDVEVSLAGEVVARLGPGDHFGELALLGRGPRTASVRALTTVRCFFIDGWNFHSLVKTSSGLSSALLESLATRLVGN